MSWAVNCPPHTTPQLAQRQLYRRLGSIISNLRYTDNQIPETQITQSSVEKQRANLSAEWNDVLMERDRVMAAITWHGVTTCCGAPAGVTSPGKWPMEGGRRGCCAVSSMAPTQVGVIQQVSNSKNHATILAYTHLNLKCCRKLSCRLVSVFTDVSKNRFVYIFRIT